MTGGVIGKSVSRVEDPALLAGRGRFVDDIHLPGTRAAVFVRSQHGHATIRGIDTSVAADMPGVRAIYTYADIVPQLTTDKLSVALPSGAYRQTVDRPVLAHDEVCHVGEPIAVVIADERYQAEDAATRVAVDYEPLPAVADCRAALEPGAPPAHRGGDGNLLAEFTTEYGDCDRAFADAACTARATLWQHKGCGHAIECRGVVAAPDPVRDRLVMWSSTQTPHVALRMLVKLLGCDEDQITVITPDVGGGFGPKLVFYQEEIVVVVAAKLLGGPIKWIEDRREHFTSTTQERDQYWDIEAAADMQGHLLAIRGSMIHDHGAFTARGLNLAHNAATILPGPYRLPNYRLDVKMALTNKVPTTPVRGAGHPQGAFAIERLLDGIAHELGLDRAELRRRNLIAAEEMPFLRPLTNRGGAPIKLDSGDYPASLAAALSAAAYDGFAERQGAARAEGRYLGIGLANCIKGSGRGPFESAIVRIGPSGRITVFTGAVAIGQGTHTMLAQVCAEHFGVAPQAVKVVAGDTSTISMGIGASASRQAVNAGSSVNAASIELSTKVKAAAAHLLEASAEDLEIADGRVHVKGVPGMSVGLGEIADSLAGTPGYALPGGIDPGLEASAHPVFESMTYPNGTHVVEVEVDIETGAVGILRYVMVSDCGRIINPMMVDGQLAGGAAHGVGNALFEWMGFDDAAQPLTATFAEYLLPSAPEVPRFEIHSRETPTAHNPLGVKGVGENGTIPATAAIISAIEDALTPFGVRIAETPITPQRIVELITQSGRMG